MNKTVHAAKAATTTGLQTKKHKTTVKTPRLSPQLKPSKQSQAQALHHQKEPKTKRNWIVPKNRTQNHQQTNTKRTLNALRKTKSSKVCLRIWTLKILKLDLKFIPNMTNFKMKSKMMKQLMIFLKSKLAFKKTCLKMNNSILKLKSYWVMKMIVHLVPTRKTNQKRRRVTLCCQALSACRIWDAHRRITALRRRLSNCKKVLQLVQKAARNLKIRPQHRTNKWHQLCWKVLANNTLRTIILNGCRFSKTLPKSTWC